MVRAGSVEVQTGADGAFVLAGLGVGSSDLRATLDGYLEAITSVEVPADGAAPAAVEITLLVVSVDWATVLRDADSDTKSQRALRM